MAIVYQKMELGVKKVSWFRLSLSVICSVRLRLPESGFPDCRL